MTRARDATKTPWFREMDRDAHHALRQGGVLPWEPPLEGDALADYQHDRFVACAIWFENLSERDGHGGGRTWDRRVRGVHDVGAHHDATGDLEVTAKKVVAAPIPLDRGWALPSEPAPASELEKVPKDWTRWSLWSEKTKTWVRYERSKS